MIICDGNEALRGNKEEDIYVKKLCAGGGLSRESRQTNSNGGGFTYGRGWGGDGGGDHDSLPGMYLWSHSFKVNGAAGGGMNGERNGWKVRQIKR